MKKGKLTLKRATKVMVPFVAFRLCSRHHRVNNNENQLCSKWTVIKWGTFIRKCFYKNYSLLVKIGKIPLKTGPQGDGRLWGLSFLFRAQDEGPSRKTKT